ncbi:type VI secretion system baseplate subunit TssE [Pseudooceanicola sp. C21-150M6]|uniref:type VI secretion system baseplate subunit TssE n=1 Tax=Pseudooceanicola sp. C21-150M6 TaxID=3434355 RepID=UPI003D7F61DF
MVDRTLDDRLQPALLDRLTDDEPDKATESRDQRVIDLRRLQQILRRDLSWLLNTNSFESQLDPDRHPNVMASVLNFGVPELTGDFTTADRTERMRTDIMRAVRTFEPRIMPDTLVVQEKIDDETGKSRVRFEIRADMWAQPLPVEIYLRSEVDASTGEVSVEHGS